MLSFYSFLLVTNVKRYSKKQIPKEVAIFFLYAREELGTDFSLGVTKAGSHEMFSLRQAGNIFDITINETSYKLNSFISKQVSAGRTLSLKIFQIIT